MVKTTHTYNPLLDGISELTLLEVMGNDKMVVNSARCSYGKMNNDAISEKDIKLIRFLMTHEHVSPFYHPHLQFRVKAPIFVTREWMRHTIGCSYNEISMRYIDMTKQAYAPQYYVPFKWREQHAVNKQGSGDDLKFEDSDELHYNLYEHCQKSSYLYRQAIEAGASREMARLFLPVTVYTEFIWTCSLYALIHFVELRQSQDSQLEIRQYTDGLKKVLEQFFPNTYEAFKNGTT